MTTVLRPDRNSYVDIMRGIAMLMVVFGHTMTGSTVHSEESFLFNVVWSLQMPLFTLISGYVARFSRDINTGAGWWDFVKRRSLSYTLPWVVWTILIRGLILGQSMFLNFNYLLWHMDAGYWFLVTIWTINMIFGAASYLASKLCKSSNLKYLTLLTAFYGIGMGLLIAVGFVAGISFLGIKLTLYYMPFYFAGYLYGKMRDRILESKNGTLLIETAIAVCLVIWLCIITRVSLYSIADSGSGVLIRAFASLTGCVAVCGLCQGLFTHTHSRALGWSGEHSLEIYLIHYLFLRPLRAKAAPEFMTIQGVGLTVLNYGLTLLLTVLIVFMLNENRWIRAVVFGKIK